MNFENFPALHDENALWWTLFFMCALGIGLMVFFWRKRYLGSNN